MHGDVSAIATAIHIVAGSLVGAKAYTVYIDWWIGNIFTAAANTLFVHNRNWDNFDSVLLLSSYIVADLVWQSTV